MPPVKRAAGAAGAGGAAGVRRQRVDGEEAVLDDFVIRHRQSVLVEVAHDEQRHMVAARYPAVEKYAVQFWFANELNIALLGQFARPAR